MHGVTESLIKSKKYLLPLVVLSPVVTGGVVAAYLADGRMTLPKDATIFKVDDEVIGAGFGDTRRGSCQKSPSLQ